MRISDWSSDVCASDLIGSGQDRSVTEVAQSLALAMGRNDGEPEIVGKARTGDIRHCFCDTGKAEEVLGFKARQDFQQGLAVLAEWVARQTAYDRVNQARAEIGRESCRERGCAYVWIQVVG